MWHSTGQKSLQYLVHILEERMINSFWNLLTFTGLFSDKISTRKLIEWIKMKYDTFFGDRQLLQPEFYERRRVKIFFQEFLDNFIEFFNNYYKILNEIHSFCLFVFMLRISKFQNTAFLLVKIQILIDFLCWHDDKEDI